MKIKRTINGINYSFELLPDELVEAFFEQRDKFDVEDIVDYCDELDDIQSELGVSYDEFISMKEEMAEEMRRNMDKYDIDFATAREMAIKKVIELNKELITV